MDTLEIDSEKYRAFKAPKWAFDPPLVKTEYTYFIQEYIYDMKCGFSAWTCMTFHIYKDFRFVKYKGFVYEIFCSEGFLAFSEDSIL